jgi:hypothetical protein
MSEMQATQGDLKFLNEENYHKLKDRIEKRGFDIPVTVWIGPTGKKHLLDGHQRKNVLETEGWDDPVPYLVVEADSLKQAAERLLEITSQYGTITQEGIDEYIATFDIDQIDMLKTTNFDAIFDFTLPPPPEPEGNAPEIEPEPNVEVVSEEGKLYCLGPHRVMCGDPKEGEVAPEKMDAYRKKYQKIMTGSEDGWEIATPSADEGF